MPGQGRQMAIFSVFARAGRRRDGLGRGLIWACVRPSRWDATSPRFCGSGQEIRRAIRCMLHSDCPAADFGRKWLGVQRKLDDERAQLALCEVDRERCASPAALRFLAIVDNAKARDVDAHVSARSTAPSILQSTQ